MIGDLFINGNDAYTTFGVCMGDGFLDAILAPPPLKEFVENKSRLDNGKQVLYDNPRLDERDLTLMFYLEGCNCDEYLERYRRFMIELNKGKISVRIPVINETYNLIYQKSASFAMNRARTFTKISVKFNEPNPANR